MRRICAFVPLVTPTPLAPGPNDDTQRLSTAQRQAARIAEIAATPTISTPLLRATRLAGRRAKASAPTPRAPAGGRQRPLAPPLAPVDSVSSHC
jgi:hypothetical protein